jgi:hypothetical protein
MKDKAASRVIHMYRVEDLAERVDGESGDCLLRLADGTHRIGYRNEDGTWYEREGDPLDPVECGPLD